VGEEVFGVEEMDGCSVDTDPDRSVSVCEKAPSLVSLDTRPSRSVRSFQSVPLKTFMLRSVPTQSQPRRSKRPN
jgi:hypothetical protein